MRPCFQVEIVTPKKVVLNGLWFGPRKPRRVFVWVHGLGSTMFGKLAIVDHLIDDNTAVLVFNNRGSGIVSRLGLASNAVKKDTPKGGAAHEVFADCVDDIQGVINVARASKARDIYLIGHSTGCQKSIYWASKKGSGVKGIMILAPMSDYAAERMHHSKREMDRAEKIARQYVKKRLVHELLPPDVWDWPWTADAQRYLSLYSGNSTEEVFPYWDPKRKPRTLHSVHLPVLVLLAEQDEYADRPAQEIADWFLQHLYTGEPVIVPGVGHSFKGAEKFVAKEIKRFAAQF